MRFLLTISLTLIPIVALAQTRPAIKRTNPPTLSKPTGYTHVVEATGGKTVEPSSPTYDAAMDNYTKGNFADAAKGFDAAAAAGTRASTATLYAAHCTDDSPLFVATWYTLATALVTALGALIGSKLLRF